MIGKIMDRINNIKIISVDLFRTLVDVDQSQESVWRSILRDNYSDTLASMNWEKTTEILLNKYYTAALDYQHFKNIKTIFEETYRDFFSEADLDYDPKAAAEILIEKYKAYFIYDDTERFLEVVGRKYPICLSTDCDLEMITNINELYMFDKIFVSEQLQAYKLNPEFFRHVINHYNLSPENILHIGDSKSDIVGAKQLGMMACWLNRNNKMWNQDIHPDFEVKSLVDIIDILGLSGKQRETKRAVD